MGAAMHWKWFVRERAGRSEQQSEDDDADADYAYPDLSTLTRKLKSSPLDEPVIVFSKLLDKMRYEDIYDGLEVYSKPATAESELYAQLKAFNILNILHSQIRVTGHLGAGCFGRVERGVWKKGEKDVEVALKTLNKSSADDKLKFLQEATLMAQFKHPNVVNLYGVASKHEPIMLVVELMHKGNLKDYLPTLRPRSSRLRNQQDELSKLLLSFSIQVTLGMQYLSSRGFVHRDLAARNILVSKKNICKVADFGMSRDLEDEKYYVSRGGMVPVKWTAPEAILYKKYSTASDVWSYGCLLYEIWSVGHTPYETYANVEVIKYINSGKRLPPPPGCPRVIYSGMISCWNPATEGRPKFRELLVPLISDQEAAMAVPQEDLATHQLAGALGAPLEAGAGMYKDLQLKHHTSRPSHTVTVTQS